MEKRIELEKRGRRANQIVELNLDNCRSTNIVGLTDEFTALESLSLINVGLTTLKGFPKLPNLKKLELSDNRISNGLNHLTTSPKLSHLNLSGNKIKDLETLKPLEAFQNLEVLDLFNNEATNVENYREKIFAMFPSLKYLDGFDANEVEASSDGDDDDEVNGNDSEDEDGWGEEDEDSDDTSEEGSEEEERGDVSLAEVYNSDMEEDNSDWGEENEAEEMNDDDEEGEEDSEGEAEGGAPADGTAANNQKEAETPAEESQARGKKRKYDG
uniref:Putative microtubule binding protein n=1 Tax=Tabanus bromius TaxID=304241 RepID=A0A0K8TPA5_TABBR